MAKSNYAKLAKGGEKKEKVTKKPVEKKVKEVPLSPEQERDIKAKETVSKLLEGSEIFASPTDVNKEELLELSGEENKSVEWLEEQVTLLSDENTKLKSELEVAKIDYGKLFTEFQKLRQGKDIVLTNPDADSAIKTTLVKLFNEIQTNHLALGRNFVIVPPAFLNRLIMFFPFLQDEKRF
jgi:hypothetical protein